MQPALRKTAAILILIFASLALRAQNSGELVSMEPISSHAYIFNGAGGSTTVKLTAKADWAIASDAPWLLISTTTGRKGQRSFTITTLPNKDDTTRTGIITISANDQPLSIEIRQRPYIFVRKLLKEGNVHNSISLSAPGTVFTRIYAVLPVPESNVYQTITNLETSRHGYRNECPDGVNSCFATDLRGQDIPLGDGEIASETFHVKTYIVVAKLDLIQDIPEYDPKSEECRQYLGKEENGYVDPFHPQITALANQLWEESSGDLISYARMCYEWTAQNLEYGNMHVGLRPIDFIMRNRISDCGNFSSVFISLLRAKGIPARHIVMMSPWEKRPESWIRMHTRAEFYVPAYGWIPVDPTYKNSSPNGNFFGVFTGPNVVMYRGITLKHKGPNNEDTSLDPGSHYRVRYWYNSFGTAQFTHQFSVE